MWDLLFPSGWRLYAGRGQEHIPWALLGKRLGGVEAGIGWRVPLGEGIRVPAAWVLI